MVSLEHRLLRKPNYTQQLKREQLHFFSGQFRTEFQLVLYQSIAFEGPYT